MTWCFPVFGCVAYRGYFNEGDAVSLAVGASRRALTSRSAASSAYSTLGWFRDRFSTRWSTTRRTGWRARSSTSSRTSGSTCRMIPHSTRSYAVAVERAGVRLGSKPSARRSCSPTMSAAPDSRRISCASSLAQGPARRALHVSGDGRREARGQSRDHRRAPGRLSGSARGLGRLCQRL